MELEKARDLNPTYEAQCGEFQASEKGWAPGENSSARCAVKFDKPYLRAPKLLFGLHSVDAGPNRPRALELAFPEVSPTEFSVRAASYTGTSGNSIGCCWMTLPNDLHLEVGMINTYGSDRETDKYTEHVYFSQSFSSAPRIAVWFQSFEWPGSDTLSIKCGAVGITPHAFQLKIESPTGRKFKNARVQYLAYPAEEHGKRVKSGRDVVRRHQVVFVQPATPFSGEPSKKTPKTFVAISEMEFGASQNLRFCGKIKALNNRELERLCGTWDGSDMDHREIQWIAIE